MRYSWIATVLLLLLPPTAIACEHGHSGESFSKLPPQQQQTYFQGVLAAKDLACPSRTKNHLSRANVTLLGLLAAGAKPSECIAGLIDEKIKVDGCQSLMELARQTN